METGPQKLFDIFKGNLFKRLVITGDVQKVFIQRQIDKRDQYVQHILWYNNLEDQLIKEFRCLTVIVQVSPSPDILGATIERYLEQ